MKISEGDARNTVHKLISVMKRHKSLFDIMREKTGLGRSAHRTLMILSDTGGLSQTSLAEKLDISTAAVAVMLKKLESDGLIFRKADQSDTRFNRISLTEKGAKIVENSKKDFYTIDAAMFEGFENSEFEVFNNYLNRLQNNIEKIEKGEKNENLE